MEITNRERQVLQLITEEYTTKEIANKLYVSIETVNTHRKNMKFKLNAKNTAGLIAKAYRRGLMVGSACMMFIILTPSITFAQTRNLQVEGTGDQLAVIGTASQGASISGIELTRGSAFNSADWRIINNGGVFQIADGADNFETPGIANFEIGSAGTVRILNGSDADVGSNSSGSLLIGQPVSYHLAIDNNGIIARNNTGEADLLLQTGLDKGNTYLNNLSGDVGIGTIAPEAKLNVQDDGFQVRLSNKDQLTNKWFIGASHDTWSVGGDKLVFSPSSSSGAAMLILDKEDNTINVRSNKVINVADPVDDQDAVNLRTLKSATKITEYSSRVSNLDFEECSLRCQSLTEGGETDWKMPSLDDATQFVSSLQFTNSNSWTTQYGGVGEPGTLLANAHFYIIMDWEDGGMSRSVPSGDSGCRCVR